MPLSPNARVHGAARFEAENSGRLKLVFADQALAPRAAGAVMNIEVSFAVLVSRSMTPTGPVILAVLNLK